MSERPYISITAHYVNANRSLSHILLDFRYIPFPHSGEQIMNISIEVFGEFEVQERVIAITSDNATNNISAIKQLNVFLEKELKIEKVCHLPCFGHVLNLAINEGMKQTSDIISNLRLIAAKLKSSPKQTQKFEETAKILDEPNVKLKRDIYIRWNSTFDLIERALRMRKVIDFMCIKDDNFKAFAISDNQW
jgi:Cu/Ag efflux pump CusA